MESRDGTLEKRTVHKVIPMTATICMSARSTGAVCAGRVKSNGMRLIGSGAKSAGWRDEIAVVLCDPSLVLGRVFRGAGDAPVVSALRDALGLTLYCKECREPLTVTVERRSAWGFFCSRCQRGGFITKDKVGGTFGAGLPDDGVRPGWVGSR